MIVVAGGSGLLGEHLIRTLLSRGDAVRVLVRNADRATAIFGEDVDVVSADVRDVAAVARAVDGATTVVSAVHGFLGGRAAGPQEIDVAGNSHLVDSARTVGADVVLLSIAGAAPDSPVDLFRAKYQAEQYLRDSGARWTIVRASAFLETWVRVLTQTARSSGRPLTFGRGQTPISFVSAIDVADVVAEAVHNDDLRGRILQVAGPAMTMTELAHAVQTAKGWHGPVRHVPRPLLRSLSALAPPVSPRLARQAHTGLAMDTASEAGPTPVSSPLGVQLRSAADVLAVARTS